MYRHPLQRPPAQLELVFGALGEAMGFLGALGSVLAPAVAVLAAKAIFVGFLVSVVPSWNSGIVRL